MDMENFLAQAKLQATTNNQNGDAASYLMQNWNDFSKYDLAKIAFEALIAAELQLKRSNSYIQSLYDTEIAEFYEEIFENLAPEE